MAFRVVNLMFARGRGGLEQAFIDYNEALAMAGCEAHAVCDPANPYLPLLRQLPVSIHVLRQHGPWDVLAARRLKQLLAQIQPHIVVGHGNRAIALTTSAAVRFCFPMPCPVVGVSHNYRTKRFTRLDGGLAITRDLKQRLVKQGVPEAQVFHMPNMVRTAHITDAPRPWPAVPVIGAMGRMVSKKGFHRFIEALAMLANQGVVFKAVIGGDGPELSNLKQQASAAGLDGKLEWLGWVEDKHAFFRSMDVFCLPSLHEPFGIVLLEAMSHRLPVVSTTSEGPREIMHHGKDGLLVGPDDARALMLALGEMLSSPEMARKLGVNAFHTVERGYAMETMSQRLSSVLKQLAGKHG